MNSFVTGVQFPTFFLAVVIATYIGGTYVGLLCLVLSALSAWFFFLPPAFSLALPEGVPFALVTFVLTAGLMVFVIA